MLDTHAHLDFPSFKKDQEEVIKRSFDKGLSRIITIGPCVKDAKAAVVLAEKYENVYAAVGIHPDEIVDEENFDKIEKLAEHSKVIAIGECGFDVAREGSASLADQKNLFLRQIELSMKLQKPLIIHIRDLHKEAVDFIKYHRELFDKTKWVIHSFTDKNIQPGETKSIAQEYLDMGGYISINGIITFKKTEELADAVKIIPLDRLMIETDCPFLAPVPHRGERCEPWMVKYVVDKIAEIKEINFEEVERATDKTAVNFFNLK